MHHEHFLNQVSDEAVATAIAEVEKKTTGRIRVYVSHHDVADPVAAAHRHFTCICRWTIRRCEMRC